MKTFYLISIDNDTNSKLFESLLNTIKRESIKNIKSIKIEDSDIGILLDALYGQILGIEKDCQKLGKKIAKLCN